MSFDRKKNLPVYESLERGTEVIHLLKFNKNIEYINTLRNAWICDEILRAEFKDPRVLKVM